MLKTDYFKLLQSVILQFYYLLTLSGPGFFWVPGPGRGGGGAESARGP